jgi:hypothetical protein
MIARRQHRALCAFVMAVFVQGCMQWKAASLEPQAVDGKRVRATLESGSQLVLPAAIVQHDSLISVTTGQGAPLSTIRHVEVRASDGVTTAAVVLTGAALVIVGSLIWAQCCLTFDRVW